MIITYDPDLDHRTDTAVYPLAPSEIMKFLIHLTSLGVAMSAATGLHHEVATDHSLGARDEPTNENVSACRSYSPLCMRAS
jgi:hypothetical protein